MGDPKLALMFIAMLPYDQENLPRRRATGSSGDGFDSVVFNLIRAFCSSFPRLGGELMLSVTPTQQSSTGGLAPHLPGLLAAAQGTVDADGLTRLRTEVDRDLAHWAGPRSRLGARRIGAMEREGTLPRVKPTAPVSRYPVGVGIDPPVLIFIPGNRKRRLIVQWNGPETQDGTSWTLGLDLRRQPGDNSVLPFLTVLHDELGYDVRYRPVDEQDLWRAQGFAVVRSQWVDASV